MSAVIPTQIIMDDVGIDQMQIFGYGGATPPLTPNINAIARARVRFRNVWSMPECSPSRAVFFEGRYPLRTKVSSAILSDDLANSQVSPFEATTPKLLKKVGYLNARSASFISPARTTIRLDVGHRTRWVGTTSTASSKERLIRSILRLEDSSRIPAYTPAGSSRTNKAHRMELTLEPAAIFLWIRLPHVTANLSW